MLSTKELFIEVIDPTILFIEKSTNNKKILALPIEKLRILKDVLSMGLETKNIEDIFNSLEKYKWNLDMAIEASLD